MLGCDLHCADCQNWRISQALRDPAAGVAPDPTDPEELVRLAFRHGARLVGSSYNEPLVTSEWAYAIFTRAKEAGLRTCYISNGNATAEVLEYLRPVTDCFKIDLKAFTDRNYRLLGCRLTTVVATVRMAQARGFWIEIVTLVIPGFNDSADELRAAAEFIASVDPLIPWHVTAFHPDYQHSHTHSTPAGTLLRAAQIGRAAGLRYVYVGNAPGVGRYEDTCCHACGGLLVERAGYVILRNRLSGTGGRCPDCGAAIPGIWN
jgi:pyruvate formate lyase activating enzyme